MTPLAPAVLDDSAHAGALVWNLPIGSTDVKAGADTTVGGGSAGTGHLTVGANKKVTLGGGVTFANRTIDPAGWVRFAGVREGLVLADWPAAAYSFENATLAGSFTLDGHTIRSRAGDSVRLVGTNDNYNARSLLNFDIADGLVEIAPNGESTWFGRTGTTGGKPATTFRMTGGTFRCLANGTGTGSGLLVGYEGGDESGNEITLAISGGTFEVPDSFLNFGTPTVVNLTGDGVLRAKGYAASIASGTINLGTGNSDTSRLEVGSLGFQPGAAAVTQRRNTAIVGCEPDAFFAGNMTLYGSGRRESNDVITVAATNGTRIVLRDMKFGFYEYNGETYNGNEPVTFGRAAGGLTGEVVMDSESAFPKRWKVAGGTVNVGKIRAQVASSLVARPADGKVVVVLTEEEYVSGASCEILYCDAWANGLTTDELRAFVTLTVGGEGRVVLHEKSDLAGTTTSATGYTYLNRGTLRLARRGLLGASRVQFGGGKMEVLISQEEAVFSDDYPLFATTATLDTVRNGTKVLVAETGSEVPGGYSLSGGVVHFKPTAVTGISADIQADMTGPWSSAPWKLADGQDVPASMWNAVIGTATLRNAARTRLDFSQTCTLTALTVANAGDLAVEGAGTMTVSAVDDSASTGRTLLGACVVADSVTAGADTVLTRAGDGMLTIAAGKRATIPGWANPANVTGAGTVSLDAGSRNAAVVWANGGVTGTNEVVRGTWSFTQKTYQPDREVRLSTTNAVAQFRVGDLTGYGDNQTKALTVADGAELQVFARDTFSRPLVLLNGGKVLFDADVAGTDGRIFDFFKNARLDVRIASE